VNDSEKIKDIEKRLSRLEDIVLNKKVKKTIKTDGKYDGLGGGIQLLIDNSFFNTPKNVPDIVLELKRETYHYPTESVRALLSRDFTKKKRILTRIQENKKYKYVIRK